MHGFFFKNIFRSLYYYRRDSVYQVIISIILTAIITGSLLTGESVRKSLKAASGQKLGNTDIVISSGLRYFDKSLASRFEEKTGMRTVSILETGGYCQNFANGSAALDINIIAADKEFFLFSSNDTFEIRKGTAAVNRKLADFLKINPGDEIIVNMQSVDPVPANAPFSPAGDDYNSRVLKIDRILEPESAGNFSLGISQVIPMNVFISTEEISSDENGFKPNRLLISNPGNLTLQSINNSLTEVLKLEDMGLYLRRSPVSGEAELISERVFIDSALSVAVIAKFSSSKRVITYLVNEITKGDKSTPYSFATGIDSEETGDLRDDEIVISSWLADDINASAGDSVTLSWYVQGFRGRLEERKRVFRISKVLTEKSMLLDPSLMPDFPGISGRTTCTSWDAGIPLLLDRIREKDEEYWNSFGGTPKLFMSFGAGEKLWSNRFGTVTAIRFPVQINEQDIIKDLAGNIEPGKSGFSVSDIRSRSLAAADSGTDFSSLFIGLTFFVIVACIILLSLSLTSYFDLRKSQVKTMMSIGYKWKSIRDMLLTEAFILTSTGAIIGVIMGYIINILLIAALNTVWTGAVQTDTLIPAFSPAPALYGFLIALVITFLLIYFRAKKYIDSLHNRKREFTVFPSQRNNRVILVISLVALMTSLTAASSLQSHSTPLFFVSGILVFVVMTLLLRTYYIKNKRKSSGTGPSGKRELARNYFHFNQWQAITPVIIVAAGIFAVIITTANRKVVTDKSYLNEGGTGGYQIYAESAIPLLADLTDDSGRREYGLDEDELSDLEVVQASRLDGDDASCLNLNHITAPPVLGIDPSGFISRGSFSFATSMKKFAGVNPWNIIGRQAGERCIYAIADQTVLDWGLKLKTGDTLVINAEDGQALNIIMCAGLKSSFFQGNLIIHENDMARYFPSVAGSSLFLFDGKEELLSTYLEVLGQRFYNIGFLAMDAGQKLASFLEVTNTYLSVFSIMGIFGLILGVTGFGFILLRIFNIRRREFALMSATGYSLRDIRRYILNDQVLILTWGILTGVSSGLVATIPSFRGGNEIPWLTITLMVLLLIATGVITLAVSLRGVRNEVLISQLRNE